MDHAGKSRTDVQKLPAADEPVQRIASSRPDHLPTPSPGRVQPPAKGLSPAALVQRESIAAIQGSTRVAAQRRYVESLGRFPAVVAQRERLYSMYRPATQLRSARGALAQVHAVQGPAHSLVIQRITVALGDLQEAEHGKKVLSKDERESAAVITEGEQRYRNATGEKQAHPWDERFRPFKSGPLASIGAENLRIYGHGQVYKGETVVSMIGGYTPQKLCSKLIEMGLPANYAGEIYLTGCETAVGRNGSYLAVFYGLITKHCSGVTVRGNLGTTVTREDGRQGVWTGAIDRELYETTRNVLNAKKTHYLEKNALVMKKAKSLQVDDDLLKKEGERLALSKAGAAEKEQFQVKQAAHLKNCDAISEAADEINKFMKLVTKGIKELDDIAYDVSGRLSVTLPASMNEDANISAALRDAKAAEEFRLTKLEIAEELAAVYGWAGRVVTEKVHSGELDERARNRIRTKNEPAPSYIS